MIGQPNRLLCVYIYLSTKHIVGQGPEWKHGRPTFYIFNSQGKDTEPWEFWLDLEVPRSHYEGNELVDIAITGHLYSSPYNNYNKIPLLVNMTLTIAMQLEEVFTRFK